MFVAPLPTWIFMRCCTGQALLCQSPPSWRQRCSVPRHPRRTYHPLPRSLHQGPRFREGRHQHKQDHWTLQIRYRQRLHGDRRKERRSYWNRPEPREASGFCPFAFLCPFFSPSNQGAFDIVHIKDKTGHSFATRISNVFIIGTGTTSAVSLPKNKGIRVRKHTFFLSTILLTKCFSAQHSRGVLAQAQQKVRFWNSGYSCLLVAKEKNESRKIVLVFQRL